MTYLVVPDANAKDSLAGAVFYPDAEPGDTLTGLSNGTAYRVYAVTEGPTVTPVGPNPANATFAVTEDTSTGFILHA